jgi:6-pyruvoyltetrahydropterin/6-carboxytetrahydropterin synthase
VRAGELETGGRVSPARRGAAPADEEEPVPARATGRAFLLPHRRARLALRMERWSIEVEKEYLKFSAAHFLIFPDGSAERLHGHNYRVYVALEAKLSRFGLVLDFQHIKPLVRELVGELDEHWILPGEHPELRVERRADGVVEVRYRERYYAAPSEDVLLLPINNTSAENLSALLGRRLLERLRAGYPDVVVHALGFAVEETAGQRGVYRYTAEP